MTMAPRRLNKMAVTIGKPDHISGVAIVTAQ
jgi:hypothetical protein